MEKKELLLAKKHFPRAEIRFLLKKLLPPNFKIFNSALNKTMFLLDKKFVFTSRNKEFVKKNAFLLGETILTAWNVW